MSVALTAFCVGMFIGQPPSSSDATKPQATNYLADLPSNQQKLVEAHARDFRRFADGSLWSKRVATEREKRGERSPVDEAYELDGAPLWYCPATESRAKDEASVFEAIDEADILQQVSGGRLFKEARAIFVTEQGILAECGEDLALIDRPKQEIVSGGQTLTPFIAVKTEVVFFDIPFRSPALRSAPSLAPGLGGIPSLQHGVFGPPGQKWMFIQGHQIQVMSWKRVNAPKSRVAHDSSPVTTEELAAAIHDGKVPGLVDWTPRRAKEAGSSDFRWRWYSKVTKLSFRPRKP